MKRKTAFVESFFVVQRVDVPSFYFHYFHSEEGRKHFCRKFTCYPLMFFPVFVVFLIRELYIRASQRNYNCEY